MGSIEANLCCQKRNLCIAESRNMIMKKNWQKLLNEDKKLQRAEKQMELLLSYLHLIKTEGEVTKQQLIEKIRRIGCTIKRTWLKKISCG